MTEDDWGSGFGRAVAVFLNGEAITGTDDRGGRVTDDSFILCFSAHDEPLEFIPPKELHETHWEVVLDTAVVPSAEEADLKPIIPGGSVTVQPRAMVVLRSLGE